MTQQVEREIIVNKNIDVVSNVGVPVSEVVPRRTVLLSEVPQSTEMVDNVEIEYLVHKQRPVATDQPIEV